MARSKFKSQATANSNALELFGRNKEPEHNLWIAVVAKGLDDALYQSDLPIAQQGITWVQSCGHNFKYVCHLAGYDWKYVYDKVIKKVNKRDKEIKDYNKGVKDLIKSGLKKKWYFTRMRNIQ
tara:strand:- start:3 stop:371 length:369 start_codon:yes stop_codon:yes gene_type:complete